MAAIPLIYIHHMVDRRVIAASISRVSVRLSVHVIHGLYSAGLFGSLSPSVCVCVNVNVLIRFVVRL